VREQENKQDSWETHMANDISPMENKKCAGRRGKPDAHNDQNHPKKVVNSARGDSDDHEAFKKLSQATIDLRRLASFFA
jgi:hypothetical protein